MKYDNPGLDLIHFSVLCTIKTIVLVAIIKRSSERRDNGSKLFKNLKRVEKGIELNNLKFVQESLPRKYLS